MTEHITPSSPDGLEPDAHGCIPHARAQDAAAADSTAPDGTAADSRDGAAASGAAMTDDSILILGGGLAGLSLAVQLVEHGVDRPITVLEPRTGYTDDRTWCFWDTDAHPFRDAIEQRWWQWRVATDAAPGITCTSTRYPYCRLPAGRFYAAALAILADAANVRVVKGVGARDIWAESGGRLAAVTDDGVYRAGLVFDGRPPGPGTWPLNGHPFMWQDFMGWRVTGRPGSFDPDTLDLMDFREAPADAVRFLYVLPLSDREALLETTLFTQGPPGHTDHTAYLNAALAARSGGPSAIAATEHGRIPMTTAPPPLPARANVIPIGTRAGAPRPSTGYAFLAIQRHTAALAARVARGRPGPVPMRAPHTRWLDKVFLTRLQGDPGGAPELFRRMFQRVPADRMVRFLTENGGLVDHGAVIAALPTLPLLRAAWASRPRRRAAGTG